MRTLLLLAFLTVPHVARSATPASPAQRLAALEQRYLDGLFRAKPYLADYMGDHRFAGKLSDVTPKGVERRAVELRAQQGELAGIDRAALDPDAQVDAAILQDGIALELLELTEIREWAWDPRLRDGFTYFDPREVVAARLSDLVHGTWGTVVERRRAAASQLAALPAWLRARERWMEQVSKVHLEQAVKDNRGRIEFFQTEVAAFTKGDRRAEQARKLAVTALQAHQAFLEKTLPARATRDWRLGAELFRKKFPLALQTDLGPEETVKAAREDFARSRGELEEVSRRLFGQLFPNEPAPVGAALINRVKDALAADHPKRDELVEASAAKLDLLRAFVDQHGFVALPPKETLSVLPMPEFKRGGGGAEYLSPDALDKQAPFHGTYYVEPVDPTWPAEKAESYLRGNNTYEITLTAAHEALPGHHTQAWWARRDPSALRATLWSGPFAEGWAVYGEGLVVKNGFGGEQNDRYRFMDLRGHMIVASNAILDAGLQGGEMTDAEAVRFMVEEGFQEQTQAERKLLRAKLDSTQLTQYFLGFTEIGRLEEDARAAGAFDQRGFDEKLLSHGTIAVKHLRRFVLGK
ncbi:DUF885 domain-containing protein [Anaeromyxobacter diazotrophicus]|uniref:DUF885 domain-containing protein n=1 Tax=Anaeromyxobacter diazotrophicus TaxID=2590199 RepID=A0A7I9VSS3_9BACT|nr:DUF885 domain-containing protein [Anaeromyxobacter diazotrophicus]GEJ59494.1 hypothetical protein AMYX_42350 [Anaeromyxobacter diazotrophicus]